MVSDSDVMVMVMVFSEDEASTCFSLAATPHLRRRLLLGLRPLIHVLRLVLGLVLVWYVLPVAEPRQDARLVRRLRWTEQLVATMTPAIDRYGLVLLALPHRPKIAPLLPFPSWTWHVRKT
jgi:hypothetical protein